MSGGLNRLRLLRWSRAPITFKGDDAAKLIAEVEEVLGTKAAIAGNLGQLAELMQSPITALQEAMRELEAARRALAGAELPPRVRAAYDGPASRAADRLAAAQGYVRRLQDVLLSGARDLKA